MKPFRLLLIAAGVLALLAIAAVVVAFNSSFQTWAARKALARQPELHATIGAVSAGLKRVEVNALRLEQDGAVLVLPRVEAELSLFSLAFGKNVFVQRLVAKGWTLDLSKTAPAPASGTASSTGADRSRNAAPAGAATTPRANEAPAANASPADAFAGVFSRLQLPVDATLDGVELEGEIVLPAGRGRVKATIKGGGLRAGHDARFDLVTSATLADPNVSAAEIRGELRATMETPRTFTRVGATLTATARGTQFPNGVTLTADLAAARAGAKETYSAAIANRGGEILTAKADFAQTSRQLDGTWKVDVRDADLAPFALGVPLPAFTAVGEGKFDTDATFAAIHATGRLNATADRLQAIKPELAALGELRIATEFDLAERGGVLSVQKVDAAITAAKPIATVRTLQAFQFSPGSGELRATDASGDLFAIALQGVPLAWVKPFVKNLAVEGGPVRGEFHATPRGGGITLRSTSPLMIDGVTLTQAGKPLIERLDFALNTTADYTPKGWQAEIAGFTAKSRGTTLLTLDAKAGQLAGAGEAVKATGKLTASLPALLTQPALQGALALTAGDATIEFVGSSSAKQELQATLLVKNLAAIVDQKPVGLPAVSGSVRADIAADGRIAFSAPLVLERNTRKSDVTLAGTYSADKDNGHTIDAQLTSANLIVDDAKLLGVVVPQEKAPANTAETAEPSTPPAKNVPAWAGVQGALKLKLQRVIYSDTFEVTDLAGQIRIEGGKVKLEGVQAGLGETGRANVNGAVTFDAAAPRPYALTADLAVREFDPGPLLRALTETPVATVEGKFDIRSKLTSRAPTVGALALGAGGDFQLTSKSGVFRGLPVNVSTLTEKSSKWAEIVASAGSVIGGLTGKKEAIDIANKAQAVAELGKLLAAIPYDQLSVVVSRDAGLNTTFKDFTLITPELRLSGSGTALHRADSTLLEDPLAMEFTLRARGRPAELLKYLGMLELEPDQFGYSACTLPLKITGTLGRPDASELSARLAALALEKSGLLDKVFGGGGK